MQFNARTWKVGDDVDTDLILPNRAFYLTPQEQPKFVFSANRPRVERCSSRRATS